MKNYRFLFDKQSGVFGGITRETPFPVNSTDIEPHFDYHFKTVFDQVQNKWKLVLREEFYEQILEADKINEIDLQFTKAVKDFHTSMKHEFNMQRVRINRNESLIRDDVRLNHEKVLNSFIHSQSELLFEIRQLINKNDKLESALECVNDRLDILQKPNFVVRSIQVCRKFFYSLFGL